MRSACEENSCRVMWKIKKGSRDNCVETRDRWKPIADEYFLRASFLEEQKVVEYFLTAIYRELKMIIDWYIKIKNN